MITICNINSNPLLIIKYVTLQRDKDSRKRILRTSCACAGDLYWEAIRHEDHPGVSHEAAGERRGFT